MVTYEQWNKAIISYFFEDCEPGQIVFLQTNAELLSEIAENFNFNVSNAVESLKEVIRNKVVRNNSVNFWTVNPSTAHLWNDYSEDEPPQVAFLALTVLAASFMDSEDSVGSQNYYIRLNELLFDQSDKGAPHGFDHPQFEECWKHLQRWAIDQHNVVLYLTEGSSKRRYVWYPISQCLINNQDRRKVYRFFHAQALTPFSKIQDQQLEKALEVWLQSSDGSVRIKRYFSNASYRKSILSQVKSLLKHWDGEILPEPTYAKSGKRQTTASVNVEIRFDPFDNNAEIRYWFPRRGRDDTHCKINPLEVAYLQQSHLEKWFQPVIDNKRTFWSRNLLNHLQLETDEINSITYTLGPSNIWVFQKDSERDDGWLSQRNLQLYEDHLIVFRKELANQIVDCLREICKQEIEKPSPIYVEGKENDWLSLRVKPTKFASFSKQELWRLSVDSGERIRLIGGISAKDRYGRRVYLDIRLPTVFVPDLGVSDQKTLQIDEKSFPVGEDQLVTLDNALTPGIYQLTYGRQTKELRVIAPERSLEHHNRTLIASISEDRTGMPTYGIKKIQGVLDGPGIWLTGAKILGDIPSPPPPAKFSKVPAHIISLVVKVAIDFKKGKTSLPEWFDEAIEYLEQNMGIQAMVEKKLNLYDEEALSYTELRKQIEVNERAIKTLSRGKAKNLSRARRKRF